MFRHKFFQSIIALKVVLIYILMPASAQNTDDQKVNDLNNRAIVLINQYKYDEAAILCDSAIQVKANSTSYYALLFIYNAENKWDEAIRNGEIAIQINPGLMQTYPILFNSYFGAKKWQKVIDISENARKAGSPGVIDVHLKIAIASQKSENISKIICVFFLIILSGFHLQQ